MKTFDFFALQRHFQPDESDLPVISQMKERFREDFDDRYTYLQELLHCASALDPRFKDLAFLDVDDNDTKDLIFLKLTAEVVKMDGGEVRMCSVSVSLSLLFTCVLYKLCLCLV